MRLKAIIRKLYDSPLGYGMSVVAQVGAGWRSPVMLYGRRDPSTKLFRKYTRISSSVTVVHRNGLAIGDNVWVWHHSILDASGGLTIGEGCQIGAFVGLFTHSSHNSIRFLGRSFTGIDAAERAGYVRKPIVIGPYTFISSGVIVLPGVTIGKGCVIGPNCVISRDVPDHSILASVPPRVVGNTAESDVAVIEALGVAPTYYDQELLLTRSNPGNSPQPPQPPSSTS